MKFLLWMILCVFPFSAFAAIYQIKDAQGNVFYTDQPSDQAKPVDLDSTGVVQNEPSSSNKSPTKNEPVKEVDSSAKNYEDFGFSNPTDQATIWNQPVISVSLSLKPNLMKGDKVALFMDGKKLAEGPTTEFSLNHPDRGQHSLQAKVMGPDGQVKKESNSITIFVHYGRVNQGAAR